MTENLNEYLCVTTSVPHGAFARRERKGKRMKGREKKVEEVSSIFPPDLSNFRGLGFIEEEGKMDPPKGARLMRIFQAQGATPYGICLQLLTVLYFIFF